jgi:hypothetical protein
LPHSLSSLASQHEITEAYENLIYSSQSDQQLAIDQKHFELIAKAFQVLSDPNKRIQYDREGVIHEGEEYSGLDVQNLGGIGRVFGAMISRFGVPLPTQVSHETLQTAAHICRSAVLCSDQLQLTHLFLAMVASLAVERLLMIGSQILFGDGVSMGTPSTLPRLSVSLSLSVSLCLSVSVLLSVSLSLPLCLSRPHPSLLPEPSFSRSFQSCGSPRCGLLPHHGGPSQVQEWLHRLLSLPHREIQTSAVR